MEQHLFGDVRLAGIKSSLADHTDDCEDMVGSTEEGAEQCTTTKGF